MNDMDVIEKLSQIFGRFPGIGPRQALRFVQFLLRASPQTRSELIESLEALEKSVHHCPACYRYFSGDAKHCSICTNAKRDKTVLMVIATDADLVAMEKSGTYRGVYFVLGGTLSLASENIEGLRVKQLKTGTVLRAKNGLKEVILAFPANPEGDSTAVRIREELVALPESKALKITALGRGLSTGSELEYADPETLKNAIESRK